MLTITAVQSAIIEALTDDDMSAGDLYGWLRDEMHPNISSRDVNYALKTLVKSGRVIEQIYLDPHGGDVGNPAIYSLEDK